MVGKSSVLYSYITWHTLHLCTSAGDDCSRLQLPIVVFYFSPTQRRYFATPESQTLRTCLVRYIVTYFYPDNDMLASTLIPRWNVICWLLSQCTVRRRLCSQSIIIPLCQWWLPNSIVFSYAVISAMRIDWLCGHHFRLYFP